MFGSLHPAIVHIPIGLLFVYSMLEVALAFFPKNKEQFSLTLYVLLFAGVVGALFALQSGEGAEHLLRADRALVQMHSTIASATVWAYAILLFAYTAVRLHTNQTFLARVQSQQTVARIWTWIMKVSEVVLQKLVVVLFAIAGAVLLTCTGALGAAIAHGPDSDPVVSFVYSLFF